MSEGPTPRLQPAMRALWQVRWGKLIVRILGWQLRGTLPPQFWKTTLVVWAPHPWQMRLLAWTLPVQTNRLSRVPQGGMHHTIVEGFQQGRATMVSTKATAEDLDFIVKEARAAKSRITLCAFERGRKFVHVHAPFRTSPFPDRDVHYMMRYFKYFKRP